jgi:hypothetical protein
MSGDRITGISEDPNVKVTITHRDQMKAQQVRAQQHPDGSTRSVWDWWFVINREPAFVSMVTRWDPDVIVHKHGHYGAHIMYVLRGGLWCGDRWCPEGTHIDVPFGAAGGPYVAGPEGVEIFEFTIGDGRSWEADPDGFGRLLRERGVVPLPNPPIELPDWMEDRRSDQAALRADDSAEGAG